ncbi:MAG TPA: hypothetical protein VL490_11565 [Mucilaginibacter sp.]|nr:hypothetical protein [Mucilaginibacter sp.]
MWGAYSFGSAQYQIFKYHSKQRKENENLIKKLGEVNTNDFYELKEFDEYGFFSLKGVFLKVEKVKKDSITFSFVDAGDSREISQTRIEHLYKMFKETFQQVTFSRQQLQDAINSNFQIEQKDRKELIVNNKKYCINNIETYFMTHITLSGANGYGEHYLHVGLKNTGWAADLISIQSVGGDIAFETTIPKHLPSTLYENAPGFEISGTVKNGNDFKIRFTVRDTIGRTQTYQVEGNCKSPDDRTLVRLK